MGRLIRRLCFSTLLCLCTLATTNWAAAQEAAKPSDPAPAKDVVVFTNGDTLTGTFVRSTGGNVTFKSDMAGEVTIGWDKIKELRANSRYAVLESGFKTKNSRKLNDARILQGTVTVAEQTITVQGETGAPTTVATKDTELILDKATYDKDIHGYPGFFSGWNGAVTGGATLVNATQNSVTLTGVVNVVRVAPSATWLDPRTRDIVNVLETYGKVTQPDVDTVKTSIFHADAEHDFYFSPRGYLLGNMSFDHNLSQGMGLQQIYGGGVGLTVVKDPKQQLDIKAQLQYVAQSYIAVPGAAPGTPIGASTSLVGATFAENYMRKLKNIVFNEQLQLVPAFNELGHYSANAQAGLIFPVYKRLAFTVNATDDYQGDTPKPAQPNSFQFIAGITYKLR